MTAAGVLAAAYLIGTAPFAFLAARWWARVDLRRSGSGNVGAANAMRLTTPAIGLAVALLDAGKGAAAVLLAERAEAGGEVQALAGVLAVIGHVAPVWLRFQGGTGVATAGGVLAALSPRLLAVALAVFLVIVWRTRYVSAGSMMAALATVVAAAALREPTPIVLAAVAVACVVLARHRANLDRIRAGTEHRLGHGLARS